MVNDEGFSDMKDKEETWLDWHDRLVGISLALSPVLLGMLLLIICLQDSLWRAAVGAAAFAWWAHVSNQSQKHLEHLVEEAYNGS